MSKPRGGLGRGLGALIPTTPAAPTTRVPAADGADGAEPVVEVDLGLSPVPGARFAEIALDSIVPNPKQPRQIFDDEMLDELKISIQEVGFLQPIVVRELGQDKYELVMGERRGLSTVQRTARFLRDISHLEIVVDGPPDEGTS